jgi:hypothetical protein
MSHQDQPDWEMEQALMFRDKNMDGHYKKVDRLVSGLLARTQPLHNPYQRIPLILRLLPGSRFSMLLRVLCIGLEAMASTDGIR